MVSKSAIAPASLLDELQSTLVHGTVARRVETLRRVTDLFINGAVDYSDEQVGLFDDVFQCLIDHIETSAKTSENIDEVFLNLSKIIESSSQ